MQESRSIFEVQTAQQIAVLHLPRQLNLDQCPELETCLSQLENSPEVRCLILTGQGEHFLSGIAPGSFKKMEPQHLQSFLHYTQSLISFVENFSKPVIAAVNGLASGIGMELALACHVVLAVEEARFVLPELELGYLPLGGGIQRLLRKLGRQRTLEITLGGYPLTAQDAYEWGLINHLFESEELIEKASEMAQLFNSKAPLAVQQALKSVLHGQEMGLKQALEFETHLNTVCWQSSDFQEGVQAFLEQRQPIFRSR